MASAMLVVTITILILGLCSQLADTALSVELVQVLFRHGERTPRNKERWPADSSAESIYEPWGLAQLTNIGKMREYRIGEMLRKRYDEFLGQLYYASDLYAYSTDHDRTKMSLQLVLAGLYHPAAAQKWNDNLSWMPIPTYYMPEKVDDLMKPDYSPLYLQALEETRNKEEILEKVSPYRDFFKLLGEKTWLNINNTSQVYEIYNHLVSKKTMDIPLPDWCTDEMYKKFQDVVKIEYEIRSHTPFMRRLNGGALIKRFVENIQANEKRDKPRKIYLYSGHEVNIAAVVRALNLTEPEIPPYGCAIIVEKLKDETGKAFVRMLYWTGKTEELKTYKLAGCDDVCPLDKYLDIVKDVVPSREEVYHKWDYLSKHDLIKMYEETLNLN